MKFITNPFSESTKAATSTAFSSDSEESEEQSQNVDEVEIINQEQEIVLVSEATA